MFTSKQRSVLRGLASTITPVAQIGKGGITDNMIESLSAALNKRELIKITVLNNADGTVDEYMAELCEKLAAEPVAAIGKKIVIYKRSKDPEAKHIEF